MLAQPMILNPSALLRAYGHPNDSWLLNNIPFFECSDQVITSIYYHRWWNYHENIKWDPVFNGWVVNEGGGAGVTACPLGHQLYEGRWLKTTGYLDDTCRFWFEQLSKLLTTDNNHSNPRGYANWFADGCWARYLVDGDKDWIGTVRKNLEGNFAGWEVEHLDSTAGLFRWIPDRDGMEASLAGFEDGEADNFQWDTVIFGGEGYRPSFNSYMFADARAISEMANLVGDPVAAKIFSRKAENLKRRVQEDLWNHEKQFFMQKHGANRQFVSGRELIGYIPWAFHLPDDTMEFAGSWKQLLDSQGFKAAYGPTTLERRNKYFMRPFDHGCLWNGPSWPYSTALTLAGLANLLHDYRQNVITKEDYVGLMRIYADTQHDTDGQPMIREDHHPDENRWLAQGANYNHSRYCDLVITGLVGLRPRADTILEVNPLASETWDYFCLDGILYHGRAVTVLYDRTGNRYNRGAGLRVLVDGTEIANGPGLRRVTREIG